MTDFKRLLQLGLLALGATCVSGGAAADVTPAMTVPSGLVPDGIPALRMLPKSGAAQEAGITPRFLDWHPVRPEMLVLARRGGSAQLHRLQGPQAQLEPLTEGRDAVQSAQWEPGQGQYLVFSRDEGGDEAFQLYRLDMVTPAKVHRISREEGRVSEYQFLPQGQGLVYLWEQLDRHAAGQGGQRQSQSQLLWVDPERPSSAKVLAFIKGGRYTALQVSPAGTVTFIQTVGAKSQRLAWNLGAPGVRAVGASMVAQEADVDMASDDKNQVSTLSTQATSATSSDHLWTRQAWRSDFRHLVQLSLESGERQALALELAADLEAVTEGRSPSGERHLAMVHNERGLSVLRLVNPDALSNPWQRIAADLPAGVISGLRWHRAAGLLAFNHASADSPGRIYVYEPEHQRLLAWSGQDEAIGQTQYQVLQWTGHDGLGLSGLHLAPPPRFTGPRPVYISIHGGPASQARPSHISATLRHLVEKMGMHVIQPNVRGSDGFGKRFLQLDNGRQREDAVKDISALLDLIATRPDMDARQVVVAGGSYGGYMSLAVAVKESERIAGSICRVGIANFVSFLENTETYRRDNRRAEYGDERDPAMRAFLERISPLNQADRIRKPLFVVHGRNDPRVPYGEAQAVVREVRAHGTPVWFLTADDEGHSFTKRDNRDYLHLATIRFVEQLLSGPVAPARETQAGAAQVD